MIANSSKINRLKYFRIKNNLTQKELASILECTQATVSHIEQKYYPTARPDILYKLKGIGLQGNPFNEVDFNNAKVGILKKSNMHNRNL